MQENKLIKTPSFSDKKGKNSTLLIIGGCNLYTGAPYFTAMSAFRSGFDLAYIMSQEDAILPLKCHLPEAIICAISKIDWILARIDICVIGPGLGRLDIETNEIVCEIISYLQKKKIFIIFDGDGLHYFSSNIKHVQNYDLNVLTPNHNENIKLRGDLECKHGLYKSLVIEKGIQDKICRGEEMVCVSEEGAPKRCGGQGDLLNGILAYLLVNNDMKNSYDCAILASKIMRMAVKKAYVKHGRSLMASDIIGYIHDAFCFYENDR